MFLFDDERPPAQRLAEKFLKLPMPKEGTHEWQLVGRGGQREGGGLSPLPPAPPLSELRTNALILFIPGIITGAHTFQLSLHPLTPKCNTLELLFPAFKLPDSTTA